MARKKSDHIHKYKRINLSIKKNEKYWVYKCIKPMCSHYIPVALSEGQVCECNKCDKIMIITKVTLNSGYRRSPLVKPHCPDCSKIKTEQVDAISAFLDDQGLNK